MRPKPFLRNVAQHQQQQQVPLGRVLLQQEGGHGQIEVRLTNKLKLEKRQMVFPFQKVPTGGEGDQREREGPMGQHASVRRFLLN